MKRKNYIIILLCIIIVSTFVILNRKEINSNNKKDITIESNTTSTQDKLVDIIDYSKLSVPYTEDNINFYIDGTNLKLSSPKYINKNRYYICLNEFIENNKGTIITKNNKIIFNVFNSEYIINISNNTCNSYKLNNFITLNNNAYYIDFCDLSNILDFYTSWDRSTKTIYCKTNGYKIDSINKYSSSIDQIGFIRLEDVTTDSATEGFSKNLESLRIMGKYLCESNIPYHIAWIPRFVHPTANIDIDLTTENSFGNAEMVYTLNFLLNNNGLIGLHGYTHQTNNDISGIGGEFGYYDYSTTKFEDHINKAIATAEYLNIPISFFETPHYAITEEQTKIAEKYFHILYYPYELMGSNYTDLTKPQLSPYNKTSYYISTPLNYIEADKIDYSINSISNADTKNMGSIFFHPYLEYDYIKTYLQDNIPNYTYNDYSPLKRVIDALANKGYKMSKVTDY